MCVVMWPVWACVWSMCECVCACVYACVSVYVYEIWVYISVCVCSNPRPAPQEVAGGERGRTFQAPQQPGAYCREQEAHVCAPGQMCGWEVDRRKPGRVAGGRQSGRTPQAQRQPCAVGLLAAAPDLQTVSHTFHLFQLHPCFPLTLSPMQGQIPGAITVWTLLLAWPLQILPAHTGSDLIQGLDTRPDLGSLGHPCGVPRLTMPASCPL